MTMIDPTQLLLERAMDGAAMRQQALAGNIANVNTPGYKRQDVNFESALRSAVGSGRPVDQVGFSAQVDASAPARADGNSVDIDQESSALAQNGLEYEALTQVVATRDQIMQNALGVR